MLFDTRKRGFHHKFKWLSQITIKKVVNNLFITIIFIYICSIKQKQMTDTDKRFLEYLKKEHSLNEETAKHIINYVNARLILK